MDSMVRVEKSIHFIFFLSIDSFNGDKKRVGNCSRQKPFARKYIECRVRRRRESQ